MCEQKVIIYVRGGVADVAQGHAKIIDFDKLEGGYGEGAECPICGGEVLHLGAREEKLTENVTASFGGFDWCNNCQINWDTITDEEILAAVNSRKESG